MITLPITDAIKAKARKNSNAIFKARPDRPEDNYTRLSEDDRYYYGLIGEQIFEQVLINHSKSYEYDPVYDGKADHGDFKLFIGTLPVVIDVKTCSKVFHKYLAMPVAQFNKYTYDAFVGVQLDGDVATVWGYCYKSHFKPVNNPNMKVPTMGVALKDLRPIEEMLDKLSGS